MSSNQSSLCSLNLWCNFKRKLPKIDYSNTPYQTPFLGLSLTQPRQSHKFSEFLLSLKLKRLFVSGSCRCSQRSPGWQGCSDRSVAETCCVRISSGSQGHSPGINSCGHCWRRGDHCDQGQSSQDYLQRWQCQCGHLWCESFQWYCSCCGHCLLNLIYCAIYEYKSKKKWSCC